MILCPALPCPALPLVPLLSVEKHLAGRHLAETAFGTTADQMSVGQTPLTKRHGTIVSMRPNSDAILSQI
jgi:hypothetical protein